MVSALGLAGAPAWARRLGHAIAAAPSRPLARVLARFDRRTAEIGLPAAAAEALAAFGASFTREDALAPSFTREDALAPCFTRESALAPCVTPDSAPSGAGPLLVLANHPGAYDALALMAALGRRDLRIVAADRRFLRALPGLAPHLLFLPVEAEAAAARPLARAAALRAAARHLGRGGALLHFPAGRIEPDPAFLRPGEAPLAPWQPGAGALLRATAAAGGRAAIAIVSGVHSARAKRLLVTRLAERRGVTTLAPLIQAALPGFGDVAARVQLGPAEDAAALAGGEAGEAALTARLWERARDQIHRACPGRSP